MKKIILALCGFLLLALISFTEKSISNSIATEAVLAKTLVGNWTYDSAMRNGKLLSLDSCDEMDFLKFDPSGCFESLQHISVINAKTGEGTTTNCNPMERNGSWSVAVNGMLTKDNQTVEIFEITETTLKLKSVMKRINEEGKTVSDVYIDCYSKQ